MVERPPSLVSSRWCLLLRNVKCSFSLHHLVHRVTVTCCMQGETGSGAAHDQLQQQLLAAREEVAQLQAERAAAELPAPHDGANAAPVLQAEGQQGGLSGSVSAMPAAAAMESPSLSSQMGSAADGSAAEWLTPIRGAAPEAEIGEVSVWCRAAPEAASSVSDR